MDLYFIYGGLLGFVIALVEGRWTHPEGTCRFTRVHKMLGADCSNIYLVNIPKLTRDVEVLDASLNRIRILRNNSFTTHYSLKFLYLGDNSISIIEPGAFTPLTYLEVLDLSLNAIRDLPPLLPPTLRRLYLSENPLQTVPLGQAKSLQYVSLAESFLSILPELGELPHLVELNLTGNPLETITAGQIASFCHLENLRLPHQLLRSKYIHSCECVKVLTWVTKYSIFVDPQINCSVVDESHCASNATVEEDAFAACQSAYQQQAATHWAVVVCTALVVLVLAIVLTILWRRRWRRPQPTSGPSQEEVRKRRLLQKTQSKNSLKF
ncbi:mimecan-like [Rhodnius prolixus]|uniref:mimecan-like n=1 Tax=Rhodnius prolixus TaxID=13249 RepID=UPI003D18E7A9